MKKYVKPDLYFESFQLNQHIAACAYDQLPESTPGYANSIETCAFQGEGGKDDVIALNGNDYCTKKLGDFNLCYSTGTDESETLPPVIPGGGIFFS